MAALRGEQTDMPPTTQLPEWEGPKPFTANSKTRDTKSAYDQPDHPPGMQYMATSRLDKIMPAYRKYWGLRRRTMLIVICIIVLAIVILIIGLSVGLSKRNAASQFLPLPSDHQSFTGDLTYYGPGLGACGVTSSSTDNIVALSHFLFDSQSVGTNPNANPLCGLIIRAERFDEQVNAMRSVDLTVVDRCTGCAPTDLDVSPGAFDQLADPAKGRVDVTWAWLSPTPTTSS
ncbi:hypothetical protein MMC11_005375 [Xylographa trunciseda]|nr:hypothetical protein [Xylographa trunciseda]